MSFQIITADGDWPDAPQFTNGASELSIEIVNPGSQVAHYITTLSGDTDPTPKNVITPNMAPMIETFSNSKALTMKPNERLYLVVPGANSATKILIHY